MKNIFINVFLLVWHIFNLPMYLKVFVSGDNHACRDDQLCASLKVGINGAVHGALNLFGKLIQPRQNGFFYLLT